MNWHSTLPADLVQFDPQDIFRASLRLQHIANAPYPIDYMKTLAPYRVLDSQIQQLAPLAWKGIDELSLYVRIPFEENRCGYCEYSALDAHLNNSNEEEYFDLLAREFKVWREILHNQHKRLCGFDIGGRTPSAVKVSHIARIFSIVQRYFVLPARIVISIETTPSIAAFEPEKIRTIHQIGIHRISMAVLPIHQSQVNRVGREVSNQIFNRAAAANIREAGYQVFNVDLMYGVTRQSLSDLEATLKHATSLNPDTISVYAMRYPTPGLAKMASPITLSQINAEANLIQEFLRDAGYRANPGNHIYSREIGDHVISSYLTERIVNGTPYLGIGLGAQSMSQYTLAYNAGAENQRMRQYREKIKTDRLPILHLYHLSLPAAISKMISDSFYFGEINLAKFEQKFGHPLQEFFPAEWEFVTQKGLMHMNGEKLQLTTNGSLQSRGIVALFYTGSVKAHLVDLAGVTQTLPIGKPHTKQSRASRLVCPSFGNVDC